MHLTIKALKFIREALLSLIAFGLMQLESIGPVMGTLFGISAIWGLLESPKPHKRLDDRIVEKP